MIDNLVTIKLGDIREELPGFTWNPMVEKEFAFDKQIDFVVIRVLTTIPRLENYGEEFIRVGMDDAISMRLMVYFRVPRTDRWKMTLRERIAQIVDEAIGIFRCECGVLFTCNVDDLVDSKPARTVVVVERLHRPRHSLDHIDIQKLF